MALNASSLRWLIGVAVGLAALHGALAVVWGPGPVIAVFPWYVPMMHSYLALAALSIAFLSFGRYRALGEPAPFWVGVAFSTFAVLAVFYVLSWPGLLPDEQGLIAQLPNTAAWLWFLKFSALALCLLTAAFARWPRAGTSAERWWFWLNVGAMTTGATIASLSLAFERFLPLLVVDGRWTLHTVGWLGALVLAFAAGAVLLARRQRQTGDVLLGYVALAALVFAFAILTALIGGKRYDLWWYGQRFLWVGGFSVILFGLLAEYVGLYEREREKANQLAALQQVTDPALAREGLESLLQTLLERMVAIMAANVGAILLLDRMSQELVLRKGVGISEDQVARFRVRVGESFAGQVAARNAVFRVRDALADSAIWRPRLKAGQSRALLGAPMRIGEEVIGVVQLEFPVAREFTSQEERLIEVAAERAALAVEQARRLEEVLKQERLRDEFISAAAHELKTPVTTIKGYVQLMRRWAPEGHEPRELEAFAVINAQCDRLSRRVEEMLEAVRYQAAPPELRRVRFDLGELAAQVAQRLQVTTSLHRLVVRHGAPVPVAADRERIEEVLASLLDNAIKFSPHGGEVEVRVRAQEENAIVAVRDHGVGIPRERQPHIFEPFYEASPAGTPGYRSVVSLSLYLSKVQIELHQGRIWFESEEGQGSTFSFRLPLAAGERDDGKA
ncbi:MAG: GAF domain-containing protein [Chloroflexi bacterium]|nr:GAF domain-containing protein [Chloroflexota bacterium]